MGNLSSEMVTKMRELGFERIMNRTLKGNSYFNIFLNSKNLFLVNVVKSPLEVEGVWLVTVFNRGENKSYDLNEIDGLTIDERGRAQLKDEKDIISFVEKLVNKIKTDKKSVDINEDKSSTTSSHKKFSSISPSREVELEKIKNFIISKASPNEKKVLIEAIKNEDDTMTDLILTGLSKYSEEKDRQFFYKIMLGQEISLDEIKEYIEDSYDVKLELGLMAAKGRKDVPKEWIMNPIKDLYFSNPKLILNPNERMSYLLAECCMGRNDIPTSYLEKMLDRSEEKVIDVCFERTDVPLNTIEKWYNMDHTPYPYYHDTDDYKLAALASCACKKPSERIINILNDAYDFSEVGQYAKKVILKIYEKYPTAEIQTLVDEINRDEEVIQFK